MEGACQEDSDFEILAISDDDDSPTASLYTSIESCNFESLNSFSFYKSMTGEAETENMPETKCNTTEKQTFDDNDMVSDPLMETQCLNSFYFLESMNIEAETQNIQEKNCSATEKQTFDSNDTSSDLKTGTLESSGNTLNQEFNHEKTLNLSPVNDIASGKMVSSNAECEINCNAKAPSAIESVENTWFSEIIEETILSQNTFNKFPLGTEKCVSNVRYLSNATDVEQRQSIPSSDVSLDDKSTKVKLCKPEGYESYAYQIPPDRQYYQESSEDPTSCPFINFGLRVCRSVNGSLHNLVSGIKSSFHRFLNTFEMEVNLMMGMTDPLKILIVGEESDSLVIEEVFYQLLSGQVIVSEYPGEKDFNMPILPVGYDSAMTVLQHKMNQARRLHERNVVIVCTVTFISEIYPQRWQLCTMLCLEDPNLSLHLHNFTSTIPVPNDYVLQVQKLTPNDYPFKDMGFDVSLGQAIGFTTDNEDLEEKLCGVHHLANLKSAAKILAGMYSKYVSRYVL